MSQKIKVLAINLVPELYAKVEPLLDRGTFEVDLFPRASHVQEILKAVRFDALIAGFPLPNGSIRILFDFLRAEESTNRDTPLLLVAESGAVEEAKGYLGRGASRVVPVEETAERLQSEISRLIAVAPRADLRFMLRMKVQLESGNQLALGQTDNVSSTGMLVSGGEAYPIGTELTFEFFLGQGSRPVSGHGTVVRHTTPGRETLGGIGIQFSSFDKDGQRRLDDFLAKAN